MATIKWSSFTLGSTIAGGNQVVGLQAGSNVIWTWANVLTYINANVQIAESQVTDLVSDLAGRQPLNAALTSIAGLTTTSNEMIYLTGSNTYATTPFTSFAGSLVSDANAAAAQNTLNLVPNVNIMAYSIPLASIAGLTTSANEMIYLTGSNTYATTPFTSFGGSLVSSSNSTVAQSVLNLIPGTNVQAWNAALASIAGLTTTSNEMIYLTGSNTYATTPFTSFAGSLVSCSNSSVAQTVLSLVPGTNVQAYSATLDGIVSLPNLFNNILYTIGTNTFANAPITALALSLLAQGTTGGACSVIGAQPLSSGLTSISNVKFGSSEPTVVAGGIGTFTFSATGVTTSSTIVGASIRATEGPDILLYGVIPGSGTITAYVNSGSYHAIVSWIAVN